MRFPWLPPLLVILATGTGCLNLKPAADPTRYFLLSVPAAQEPIPGTPSDPVAVGVSPVALPGYLDNPWMAIREGENEIRYSSVNRWGERLDQGIRRVLAANLSHLLATERIEADVWKGAAVRWELSVEFRHFEIRADGRVEVEGRWRILRPSSSEVVRLGHHRVERAGPPPEENPAGAAEELSLAFADFCHEVAASILAAGD